MVSVKPEYYFIQFSFLRVEEELVHSFIQLTLTECILHFAVLAAGNTAKEQIR